MFRTQLVIVFLLTVSVAVKAAIGINGGPCQYNNFPSAIAAASAGDTLYIQPGNYISFIGVIDKSLTFKPGLAGAPDFTGCEEELDTNDKDVIMVNGNGASHDLDGGLGKLTNGATVSMHNMTLFNATALNGGILAVLDGAHLHLHASVLRDGSASNYGGNILVSGSAAIASELTLHAGSQLIDGHSDFYGGSAALINAELTAFGGQIGGADQTGGSDAEFNGGAIYANSSILTFYNGAYVVYSEAGINGGGIYAVDTDLVIRTGTHINYNTAQASGGGIHQLNGQTLVDSGAEIRGNTSAGQLAEHGGGGVNLTGAAVMTIVDGDVLNNLANGNGGGIRGLDESLIQTESDAVITGNVSFSDGGGLAVNHHATIVGTLIDNNTSYGMGGGLACLDCQGLMVSGAASFTNNDAKDGGGLGLRMADEAVAVIQGLTIEGNKADHFGIGNGGGLYLESGSLQLTGAQIQNNEAYDNGGGIYMKRANGFIINEVSMSSVLIAGNVTTHSSGNEGGAGLYAYQVETLDMNGVSFAANDSTNIGGAIYANFMGQVMLEDCLFSNNQGSLGGAVYLSGDALTVQQSEFTGNDASSSGGGLYLLGVETFINNSTFDSNLAIRGGGIYLSGGSAIILNSEVNNNQADFDGGGIYAYRSDLVFAAALGDSQNMCDAASLPFNQYCASLVGNQSLREGGAIFARNDPGSLNTVFQVSGALLSNNLATDGGSAMKVEFNNAATVTLNNSLLHHNGSGVDQEVLLDLNVPAAVSLSGLTITQNQGQPFVLDTPGLAVNLKNNIIHDNALGPYVSFSVLLDDECNLSQNPESGSQATGSNLGDPLFTSTARGPYRLAGSSPAVDACASGPALDMDGQLRPGTNGLFDLGAFEMDGQGAEELIFRNGFQW
jgi:hypothetical protein